MFEEAGVDKGQAFLQFLVELEIKSNGGSLLEFTTKSRKTKFERDFGFFYYIFWIFL